MRRLPGSDLKHSWVQSSRVNSSLSARLIGLGTARVNSIRFESRRVSTRYRSASVPFAGMVPRATRTVPTAQLVQALAGFGGGAADTSATAPLSADASQQTFLTAPRA